MCGVEGQAEGIRQAGRRQAGIQQNSSANIREILRAEGRQVVGSRWGSRSVLKAGSVKEKAYKAGTQGEEEEEGGR